MSLRRLHHTRARPQLKVVTRRPLAAKKTKTPLSRSPPPFVRRTSQQLEAFKGKQGTKSNHAIISSRRRPSSAERSLLFRWNLSLASAVNQILTACPGNFRSLLFKRGKKIWVFVLSDSTRDFFSSFSSAFELFLHLPLWCLLIARVLGAPWS